MKSKRQTSDAALCPSQALNTLTKNDISEVKGMKSPPPPVRLVMEAVCVLKGLKPTKVKDPSSGRFVQDYWETSKKMLSDIGFLESLKAYDKVGGCLDAIQPPNLLSARCIWLCFMLLQRLVHPCSQAEAMENHTRHILFWLDRSPACSGGGNGKPHTAYTFLVRL